MANSPNPLRDMTGAVGLAGYQQERPTPSFTTTALPGFKQALEARRAIREYDGEPVAEQTMRDCLRDATLAPSSSNLQVYQLY